MNNIKIICILFPLLLHTDFFSQLKFTPQLVQRAEYRNGYGKLIQKNTDPAVFMSQRFRLQGKYQSDKMTIYGSIQDIRTWGNTSQIKLTDGFLSVHEAWAELNLDSSISLKLGRQELNYDNFRFLGNLDWAMQGRAHDFALLKYEKGKSKLHLGGGFNQDAEALNGNLFTISNQYKTAQLLRYEFKTKQFLVSVMGWNNGKQFIARDSLNKVTSKSIRYSQTIGLPTIRYDLGNLSLSAFAYYQTGQDVNNKNMNAFDASLQFSYLLKGAEGSHHSLKTTLGGEIISGTANNNTSNTNSSFSPMYGTNHAHNGYMDMFYIGNRYENSTGLYDYFLRAKYDYKSLFFVSVNGHMFSTFADFYSGGEKQDAYLGTELDGTLGYIINKSVSVQAGYSQIFSSSTLEKVQAVSNIQGVQNWAYLMLIWRPESDKKFIGLLY